MRESDFARPLAAGPQNPSVVGGGVRVGRTPSGEPGGVWVVGVGWVDLHAGGVHPPHAEDGWGGPRRLARLLQASSLGRRPRHRRHPRGGLRVGGGAVAWLGGGPLVGSVGRPVWSFAGPVGLLPQPGPETYMGFASPGAEVARAAPLLTLGPSPCLASKGGVTISLGYPCCLEQAAGGSGAQSFRRAGNLLPKPRCLEQAAGRFPLLGLPPSARGRWKS